MFFLSSSAKIKGENGSKSQCVTYELIANSTVWGDFGKRVGRRPEKVGKNGLKVDDFSAKSPRLFLRACAVFSVRRKKRRRQRSSNVRMTGCFIEALWRGRSKRRKVIRAREAFAIRFRRARGFGCISATNTSGVALRRATPARKWAKWEKTVRC